MERASKTAIMTAAYRARASGRPAPICHDPWAAALVGPEGDEITRLYDRVTPNGELYMAVRTAFIDSLVAAAVARGVDQVVLLGAGLDTRAARLARPGVRFFEVDRPASQEDKLSRVRALAGYPVEAATYVPCEFGRDDFLDRLAACGLAPGRPALLVWEGVSYHLAEPVVRATLSRIASGCEPRSVLVFDYVERKLAEGLALGERDRELRAIFERLGEPFVFGLNDPVPILHECGFRHVRTVSFDQACLELTGTYDRARAFRFQHVAIASRATPAPR